MTYLRHSARHVHQTVASYLREHLTSLGWIGPPESTPFGATPVRLRTSHPPEWKEESRLEAGTIAVTLGDENAALLEELGGPLSSVEHPIFVDIFMDNEAITLALALDVRDLFHGRLPGSARWLSVLDFTYDPPTPVAGWALEFDDITRVRPETASNWQIVKTTAVTYFPEIGP